MKGMAITRNPANFNKFQFLNRETQFETGYIDLIHRQFDPTIARFISQDPVIEGQEHLSLYQYSWNNPILKSDPNGDCPFCPAIPLLPEIGAGVIALGEYVAGSTLGLAVGAGLTKLANSGVLAGGGNSVVPYYAQMKAKQAEKELTNEHNTSGKNSSNTRTKSQNKVSDTETSSNEVKRVKPRKGTIAKVRENQPKNEHGEMLDPNTGEVLDEKNMDLGHKPGYEWRTRKKMHEDKGSTRKEVIEAENDPNLYHYENRNENRSHKHEKRDKN
jgi:RHS repeat-associated protein